MGMLYVFLFKIFTILSGSFSIYLGYKLFVKGIFSDAGEVTGTAGNYNLTIKKAAPGTFFSVFGAIIICCGVLKGFTIESEGTRSFTPLAREDFSPDASTDTIYESVRGMK